MARFPGYAPQYRIRIDGREIPPGLRGSVQSIKHETDLEKADSVEITIANLDYRWSDHELLQEKMPFELSFGYAPDPLEVVFTGEINVLAPTFPMKTIPTIKITAHDLLNRLTRNRRDEGHQTSIPFVGNLPLPDDVVVQSALSSLRAETDPVGGALSVLTTLATYLLAPQIGQGGVRIQESESDFEFLTRIAKENGWEMYVDHTAGAEGLVLRFKSLVEDYSPVAIFNAGTSIMDFEPRISVVGDVAAVSARIWVDSLKEEFVIALGWDFDRSAFDIRVIPGAFGPIADLLGLGGDDAPTIDIKPSSFATAVQQLFREILPRLKNRHTGSLTVVGDPKLRPGELIGIGGVGARFGGMHRITSAKNTFDQSGYVSRLEVRKEPWLSDAQLPAGIEGLARALGQVVA